MRLHQSLRVTPAMQAGISDNIRWEEFSLEENGNLHISLGYDSGFIITGENDGYSVKDIISYINFNPIFKPARNIFKKIPNAKSIKV